MIYLVGSETLSEKWIFGSLLDVHMVLKVTSKAFTRNIML